VMLLLARASSSRESVAARLIENHLEITYRLGAFLCDVEAARSQVALLLLVFDADLAKTALYVAKELIDAGSFSGSVGFARVAE
jgi:hypothetical protein